MEALTVRSLNYFGSKYVSRITTNKREYKYMTTLKGKVKWFNGKKGYGFIEREDGEKDCFVHASAVREAGLRFLNENDSIEFEIQDGDKGPSAVNLKKTS